MEYKVLPIISSIVGIYSPGLWPYVRVNEVVKAPADYKAAIDGYFIYLGTMLLGDEVLESITSDLGDSKDQEGIVVRGLYPDVFKITGSFIIKGMESQFRK